LINFDDRHTFYLVPNESLDELIQAVTDLKRQQEEIGKGSDSEALGDYIPEDKAMELLDCGKHGFSIDGSPGNYQERKRQVGGTIKKKIC